MQALDIIYSETNLDKLEDMLAEARFDHSQTLSVSDLRRILLLRSRIDYLKDRQITAEANHWGPILCSEIITDTISLYTLLYLSTEPEVVRKISIDWNMSKITSDINQLVRVFRDNSHQVDHFKKSGYNYQRPSADDIPTGFIGHYAIQAASHGHDDVLDAILSQNVIGPAATGTMLCAAVEKRQLSSIQVIAKYYDFGGVSGSKPRISSVSLKDALAMAAKNEDLVILDLFISLGVNVLSLAISSTKIHSLGVIKIFVDDMARRDPNFELAYCVDAYTNMMKLTLKSGFAEGFDFLYQFAIRQSKRGLPFCHSFFVTPSIEGGLFDKFCWAMDMSQNKVTCRNLLNIITIHDRADFISPFIYPHYAEMYSLADNISESNRSQLLGNDKSPLPQIKTWRERLSLCIIDCLIKRCTAANWYFGPGYSSGYNIQSVALRDPLIRPNFNASRFTMTTFKLSPLVLQLVAYLSPGCHVELPKLKPGVAYPLNAQDLEILDMLLMADSNLQSVDLRLFMPDSWRCFIGCSDRVLAAFMDVILPRIFFEWWQEADQILDFLFTRGIAFKLAASLRRRPGRYYDIGSTIEPKAPPVYLGHLFTRLLQHGITGGIGTLPGWAMRFQHTQLLQTIENLPGLPGSYNGMLESAASQGQLHYVKLAVERGATNIKGALCTSYSPEVIAYLKSL